MNNFGSLVVCVVALILVMYVIAQFGEVLLLGLAVIAVFTVGRLVIGWINR